MAPWKMNESNWWTSRLYKDWVSINLPYTLPIYIYMTNIYIFHEITTRLRWILPSCVRRYFFFFSQVKPRGVRSKRNCELSGPRRESGWMKCLTYRWMGRPECLSGVQWTYLKQRKEYWLISAVSWAVYHATKDNTWYHFKT